MNSKAILRAWRELLPPEVCVSAGPILPNASPLTARERASAGSVSEGRLRELENGRAYAKRALAMLGIVRAELLIAPDRSPLWPVGVVGSLTHVTGRDGGHFAAAVARTHAVCAIGIDVERDGDLHASIWSNILTAGELERIRTLPVSERVAAVQMVWCAKEAIVKAMRRPTEPTQLEIALDLNWNSYLVTWQAAKPGRARSVEIWHGRTVRSEGFILSSVVVPRK